MAGPLNPVDPLFDSDTPTMPPPGFTEPTGPNFFQTYIDAPLGATRNFVSDMVKAALPILSPPGVQAGQGGFGGKLLEGAVDLMNPIPGDTSDLLRDIAVLAVPGGKHIQSGMKAAIRPGARIAGGTLGAATGAALSDQPVLPAAGSALVGTTLGEAVGNVTQNVGRMGRQQAEDVKNVTRALNNTLVGQSVPGDVEGMFARAYAPKGMGSIREIARERFQNMVQLVEQSIDPGGIRPLMQIPGEPGQRTFRQIMDWMMRETPQTPKAGVYDAAKSVRTAFHDKMKVREMLLERLRGSKNQTDHVAADFIELETKNMFRNMTVRRLLRSPGVLNENTGMLDMRALQEAFKKELAADRVPADVSADLQAAFWRNAKPPQMDMPGEAGALKNFLYGMSGAGLGSLQGHPVMGYHAGIRAAQRNIPDKFVGQTVGPSPLSQTLRVPISIGTAQGLDELLSNFE